ncbi:C-GCAxxG-C-C family protein, partial [Chloroflexota bacterium]
RPEANHCAPSTIIALQEAYDLPGGELLPWIASGFRGGVCLGEICGALSGAVIAMGLMSYKVLEPRTDHEQKLACAALLPYIRDLGYAFNRKFGSIHCAALTRLFELTPEEAEIEMRTRLRKEICREFVEYVVRKMVNWGEVSQEPPQRVPPGTPPLKLG